MRRPIFYMAHPFGGKPENLERAKRWLRWLWTTQAGLDFMAPWIPVCEVLSDKRQELRTRGLNFDCEVVKRCDAVILVGGHVSEGMAQERDVAAAAGIAVIDLTSLGEEPPGECPPQ